MDLDNKYELLDVVANDAESKTFQAREVATGRAVFVHIIFGGMVASHQEKLLDMVLHRLVDASAEKRRQILEVSDYKGMPYAVTDVLPGFRSLREWLEADRQPEAPPAAGVTGERTDRFARTGKWAVPPLEAGGAPPRRAAPLQDAETLQAPTPGPSPVPAGPAGKEPGEFTRLFHAAVPSQAVTPPAVSPVAPEPPRPAAEPDEFARLFGAASEAPATPAPPGASVGPAAPAKAQEPGEFTRIFQASPPVAPPSAAASPSQGAGEFARLFQAPGTLAPPLGAAPDEPLPKPAVSGPQAGEFTRLFGAVGGAQAPASGAPPEWMSQPQPHGLPQTPPVEPLRAPTTGTPQGDEFTRLFGSGAGPGSGLPGTSGAPIAPPPRPGGATGLFSTPAAPTPFAAQPPSSGPGEYTRMFGTPPAPATSVEPQVRAPQPYAVPPAPQPQPRPQPSSRLLLIVFGALGLVAVLLIIFFLVKR